MSPAAQTKTWTDLLACPACRAGLNESATELTCRACGRRYPIKDGIPQLMLEDAKPPAEASGSGSGGRPTGKDSGT
ncbi:MAG: Trm112 family protein [Chloroflexota bacterium]|nr:Trm112 family protein [Chloroflexota bacterium]